MYSFSEYHKIESGLKTKASASAEQIKKEKWIVLEKVHGANFSFYCNGKTLVCSKRNALLGDVENFFNFQKVRDKYRDNVYEIFNKLQTHKNGKIEYITIFGELFGGFYPHASVPDLGLRPVQKEIYYSDKIDFYAFDVRVLEKGAEEEEQYWLDYKLAMKLFRECGFFFAEPLLEGTLDECLAFNYEINTTIPAKLNLPLLPKNQCEGVVVKSISPIITRKGRVIFKLKNAKFTEVNPKHQSLFDKSKDKRSGIEDIVKSDVARYINHNRVISLKSKIGAFGIERHEEVTKLLLNDVITDYKSDFPDVWALLPNHEPVLQSTKIKISAFVVEWLKSNA